LAKLGDRSSNDKVINNNSHNYGTKHLWSWSSAYGIIGGMIMGREQINRDKLHRAWKLWDAETLGYIPRTDNKRTKGFVKDRMGNIIGLKR
jgi:hypothetical protein